MSLRSVIHLEKHHVTPKSLSPSVDLSAHPGVTVAEDILKQAFNSVIRKHPTEMMALYDNHDMDHKMARLICDELSKMGYWIGECAF